MVENVVQYEGTSIYNATIDGVEYAGIHPGLGLFARVQQWLDAGGVPTVVQVPPTPTPAPTADEKRATALAAYDDPASQIKALALVVMDRINAVQARVDEVTDYLDTIRGVTVPGAPLGQITTSQLRGAVVAKLDEIVA